MDEVDRRVEPAGHQEPRAVSRIRDEAVEGDDTSVAGEHLRVRWPAMNGAAPQPATSNQHAHNLDLAVDLLVRADR
jgi:hypothetical protein